MFSPDSVRAKLDYSHFSSARDNAGYIWLAGIDNEIENRHRHKAGKYFLQDGMWVMCSKDGAKTWQARKIIGRGDYPTIACAKNGDLLVFSRESKKLTSPGFGALMMQRSRDNGQTWSKPLKVIDDKVIQTRVYRAPDNRLWLAYVQTDSLQRRRTSLWLTSSNDDGKTWKKPQRITDGKRLDREPDMIWRDGKLLIVFSRAGGDINTNIWLAEVG